MRTSMFTKFMLTMLVIGAAGTLLSAGTFASFNAVTTNTASFATGAVSFTNNSNGATCTSVAGATATPACGTLGTAVTSMGPGDSLTGFVTLKNDGAASTPSTLPITVGLTVADSVGASALHAAFSSGATSGLGVLIFRCLNGAAEVACNTASTTLTLQPIYPASNACGGTNPTVNSGTGFSKTYVVANADNTMKIGGGTGVFQNCTGGTSTFTNFAIGGPDTTPAGAGLNVNSTDNLAIVAYLPATAGNTTQAQAADTYTFTWTASDAAAATSH